MSIIKANAWQKVNGTVVGTPVQVVSSTRTSAFSSTSDSYVDVSGLSVSITPQSSSNKILVLVTTQLSHIDSNTGHIKLFRGATQIAFGDALGSFEQSLFSCRIAGGTDAGGTYMIHPYTHQWLDSPATTSATTYKIQARARGTTPFYINRSGYSNTSDNNMGAVASSIILMEIQA